MNNTDTSTPAPVTGIVDTVDDHALIRVAGYLPSAADVYVPPAQLRRYGLRRGDLVTGAVAAPPHRGRHAPLVRLDTVNGMEPEEARRRPEFYKLTPLYPQERLRLETEPHILTTRVIDLVMPIGKGQRALIVSPPKAGKTMVLQAIANAITRNNPECHLMVVLVDERPEEVTDFSRSVKGEVIAATFDRPPQDHTTVAELAIERAKRLVELGHDVVVLLDSVTRLGRAYNLSVRSAGRTLSGGVDIAALNPPKRLLAAARAVEEGGSLTILASALVDTGSAADTLIHEELKSTGNAELRLDRALAERRTFPAVDVRASGTRREELLLTEVERHRLRGLRSALSPMDRQAALDRLLHQLTATAGNAQFLIRLGAAGNYPQRS
ncbi:transcription termination factor Rho [Micromonospora eburnea]|uniref:Transcription termination factor Rho n=1 Tax=Micromonospora eburnea TaxID=227316 RepID=A0A1C6UP76_9ACTN|nr:transcription termination factor Rho [Micromonospora eburnea]